MVFSCGWAQPPHCKITIERVLRPGTIFFVRFILLFFVLVSVSDEGLHLSNVLFSSNIVWNMCIFMVYIYNNISFVCVCMCVSISHPNECCLKIEPLAHYGFTPQ